MTLVSQHPRLKNKPLQPEQVGPMDRDVLVLRKLNMRKLPDGVYEMVSKQHITPGIPERDMPWFADGYVSNDTPRDTLITGFLLDCTEGFAIARTDTGQILKSFAADGLARADVAVQKARVELALQIALDDEEEPEPEEDLEDEDPAAPAAAADA